MRLSTPPGTLGWPTEKGDAGMGSVAARRKERIYRPESVGLAWVAVIGSSTKSNCRLEAEWRDLGYRVALQSPSEALEVLGPGDVALVRLDVLPTLDGVEAGLDTVSSLVGRGVRVLNPPEALLAVHDKLVTCERLSTASVRQPRSFHVPDLASLSAVSVPCVVKPRFGSWGLDVFRCRTRAELEGTVRTVAERPWFAAHGALVQELLPTTGQDLRVLVAGGRVTGAARRIAAPGEWRTNVALGGSLERIFEVPDEAAALSLAATAAADIDFVGIDLLPLAGGYVVVELNGAAEFDEHYSLRDRDVYADIAATLELPHVDLACARRTETT
jgi:RimK family alpha-L-glutamate ligase